MAEISNANYSRLAQWVHGARYNRYISEFPGMDCEKMLISTPVLDNGIVTLMDFNKDDVNVMSNTFINGISVFRFLNFNNTSIEVSTFTDLCKKLQSVSSYMASSDIIRLVHEDDVVYCAKGCIFDCTGNIIFGIFNIVNNFGNVLRNIIYASPMFMNNKAWFYGRIRDIYTKFISYAYTGVDMTFVNYSSTFIEKPVLLDMRKRSFKKYLYIDSVIPLYDFFNHNSEEDSSEEDSIF